jgi:hypothetical protein
MLMGKKMSGGGTGKCCQGHEKMVQVLTVRVITGSYVKPIQLWTLNMAILLSVRYTSIKPQNVKKFTTRGEIACHQTYVQLVSEEERRREG